MLARVMATEQTEIVVNHDAGMHEVKTQVQEATVLDEEILYIAQEIESRLSSGELGGLLRKCLDHAIDSGYTKRVSVDQLSQPNKTAIGAPVEEAIKSALKVEDGDILDMKFANAEGTGYIEVDVKWSTGKDAQAGHAWMIPGETRGHIALIVTGWDTSEGSFFRAGLLRIPDCSLVEFGTRGFRLNGMGQPNKDKKRGLSKEDGLPRLPVRWLYASLAVPLPGNVLLEMPEEDRLAVFAHVTDLDRSVEARDLLINRVKAQASLVKRNNRPIITKTQLKKLDRRLKTLRKVAVSMSGNLLLQMSKDDREAVLDKTAGAERIEEALAHLHNGVIITAEQLLTLDIPDLSERILKLREGWGTTGSIALEDREDKRSWRVIHKADCEKCDKLVAS